MCLALVIPPGKTLPNDVISGAFRSNPDGAGYMFAVDGRLRVHKGLMGVRRFERSFRRNMERYGQKSAFVAHFRLCTHGKKDTRNTHPHWIGRELAYVHNGILPIDNGSTPELSDTAVFARILGQFRNGFHRDGRSLRIIESFIGKDNKLVFLDAKGEVCFCNESSGHWQDGIWYSNYTYVAVTTHYPACLSRARHDDLWHNYEQWGYPSRYAVKDTKPIPIDTGKALDRHVCDRCHAALPFDLIGISEICWTCLGELEEQEKDTPEGGKD